MKKLLKKIGCWLLVLLLSTIFFGEYILSNFRVDFEIAFFAAQSGQFQLFYYSGNELNPFDQQHSMNITFGASGERQTVRFRIPQIGMQSVRLDVSGAEELLFDELTSTFLGEKRSINFQSGIDSNIDNALDMVNGQMHFQKTGEMPQIYFRDLREYDPNLFPTSVGMAVFFTGLLFVLVHFIKRQGNVRKLEQHRFLFEELVVRDFKKKYKRTVLGMVWSLLNPLLMLLVMWLVFSEFFGTTTEHYIIYLFSGNVVFSYFSESTGAGMNSLISNSSIFSKVAVPKYLFLFSQNVTSLINFWLTLIIFFAFVAYDGIPFSGRFVCLVVPIFCLMIFNIGIGLILSAFYVFFRDIEYLWNVFTMLLMYLSAIFYDISSYSPEIRYLFYLNPVYVYIRYIRKVVIEFTVPSIWMHLLAFGYAFAAFGIGCLIYKKNNQKFLYYV